MKSIIAIPDRRTCTEPPVSRCFDSVAECAEALAVSVYAVYNALHGGYPVSGYYLDEEL